MFHYRWYYDDDIDMAGTILPMWTGIQASSDQLKDMKHYVANRQISRLYVVGSNDLTAPVIEASYVRFLSILDRLIEKQLFCLGSRPSSADFCDLRATDPACKVRFDTRQDMLREKPAGPCMD